MAETVIFLYESAHTDSTRKTYAVGQRHWARFQANHPSISFFPFTAVVPDPTSLALCFFAAYLATRPKIKRYTTVRCYLCHLRSLWWEAGCPEKLMHSPLLNRIMRGIRRALPTPPDAREAFIPPCIIPPRHYIDPPSLRLLLFKAAVVMGFHAMLRFGAFCQFYPEALAIVYRTGRERAWTSFASVPDISCEKVLGVIFTFTPKFTLSNGLGCAYFCHICDVCPRLAIHCPLCVLAMLTLRGFLRAPNRCLFDPLIFTPASLTSYLGLLAGKPGSPPSNPFRSHSLRIGGHTFYTIQGMNLDLRDYLARRAVTRSSLRYFRASPAANLLAIRTFYKSLPDKSIPSAK